MRTAHLLSDHVPIAFDLQWPWGVIRRAWAACPRYREEVDVVCRDQLERRLRKFAAECRLDWPAGPEPVVGSVGRVSDPSRDRDLGRRAAAARVRALPPPRHHDQEHRDATPPQAGGELGRSVRGPGDPPELRVEN